jgi:hypothetical protein
MQVLLEVPTPMLCCQLFVDKQIYSILPNLLGRAFRIEDEIANDEQLEQVRRQAERYSIYLLLLVQKCKY